MLSLFGSKNGSKKSDFEIEDDPKAEEGIFNVIYVLCICYTF
jgi:hypothetical protein